MISTSTPVYVKNNVEFLVNTNCLGNWRDVKTDMIIDMVRSETKTFYFEDLDDQLNSSSVDLHDYKVTRYVYAHKKYPDFHKVILSVTRSSGEQLPLFYVQYYFEGEEYEIEFSRPHHGNNTKKDKPRQVTSFSVRDNIKSLSSQGKVGKKIFTDMSSSIGGFSNARTTADLPNSLRQIHDISRKAKHCNENDELVELLDLCKGQLETPNVFLRDVRTAPEKSVFLSTNQQLIDIERFCSKQCLSILGVDPTFNICDYNVTISTYRHPLLISTESKQHPVMIGPTIIHCHKTFESYYTLPSNIIRFKPSTKNLKAFGTDDERNVYEAMKSCFSQADHLLCTIHMLDNIKSKCVDLKIDSTAFVAEIFGVKSGEVKVKGLIDCVSDQEFEQEYKRLTKVWQTREKGEEFIKYIDVNKKEKMKTTMLASVRTRCGLGNPPENYNQNGNESINSMIKKAKKPGKLSLKETIKLIQEEVNWQEEKVKLALVGKGMIL